MASPGYPPQMGQGQMGQMQGGPPHMQQQMQMPPRPPAKRGTSRAVPIVVSAGLAVGVFCGLLFGLGTDKNDASAGPAKGNNVKASDDTGSGSGSAGLTGLGATAAIPAPPKAGSGASPPGGSAAAPAGTGSGSAVAAGAGSGSAAVAAAGTGSGSAVAAIKTLKLTVEITPDAAATTAKIVVDGKEITGKTIDLPVDKKSVKLSVTANGFHSIDKKIDFADGDEMVFKVEMIKRATGAVSPGFGGASSGGNHVPTVPPGTNTTKKKPPPGSGIIDI